MADAPAQKSHARLPRLSPRANAARRFEAAGLDAGDADDIHAFRLRLARRIYMIMNQWHGCREPLCRRFRGCMAPDGICTNLPPLAPEQEAAAPEEIASVRAALCEAFARRDSEEDHGEASDPSHPEEPAPRRKGKG